MAGHHRAIARPASGQRIEALALLYELLEACSNRRILAQQVGERQNLVVQAGFRITLARHTEDGGHRMAVAPGEPLGDFDRPIDPGSTISSVVASLAVVVAGVVFAMTVRHFCCTAVIM